MRLIAIGEWTMSRHVIAFLVAPAAVPLLMLPLLAWGGGPLKMKLVEMAIAAAVSYGGTIVFGIPAYLELRKRELTAAWIAPVTGFAIGAFVAQMPLVLASLVTSKGLAEFGRNLIGPLSLMIMLGCGVLGMIVGVLLWVIARPDRAPPYRRGV